ncbi:MAG: MaoC/PaaZ C-terminal domain-containing protein [Spirochaetes bacterium]|nr:MaoC/PaaZ C-terminal domain-containing protein [Spirochaetota bacterium]
MKIDSSFVGTPLKAYTTTISSRATMNYAAAIDDDNPLYFNDEFQIIAPPMFAVACTWPISERIWDYIDNKIFPFEIIKTQVHYTEHLRFYRAIVPGDVLTIKGNIVAITPHKAGTVITICFNAYDNKGDFVFTEHIGGLMRGVECTDKGRGKENLPTLLSPKKTDDEVCWIKTLYIDRTRPYIYDGCTNIHFPIHTSKAFAKMVGLPDILLQGTATLAYAAREIINIEANGNANSLNELSCRFTGMMIPPGNIQIVLLAKEYATDSIHCFFEVHGSAGRIISNGYAKVTI